MVTLSSREALPLLTLRLRLGVVTVARLQTYCSQHIQGARGPELKAACDK